MRSHRAYRQGLLQALRRAQRHQAQRVYLGMGATLEKERFGAHARRRSAYVRAGDHYAMEVMAGIEADAGMRPAAAA